ncbi:MAG: hypothetical protein ACRDUY_14490 [Nitriliruptorales bacterium]
MTDFEDALRARLARNVEFEREREQDERQRQADEQAHREAEQRRRREEQGRRDARHAEMVAHLQGLLAQLEGTATGDFVSRGGWTESGEEFVVKVTSVQLSPRRSLFVELDRDDDEVLARWTSDVGESIEMWRLLEFTPEMLSELMLRLVDQELWRDATGPPPFPGAD